MGTNIMMGPLGSANELPPRAKRKPLRIGDIWILIFCLVSSVLLLGALVGLLFAFDGKPIFDSGLVTLNTLVAVLSTGYKASIIHALSFVMAQSKWVVFTRGRRRLLDFDRIETAGEGPLGSILLLFNFKVKNISMIRVGAMFIILAVATDPFTQQLLQFRQTTALIDDPSNRTAIFRASRYSRGSETRTQAPSGVRFVEGNSTSLYRGNIPITADADFSMQSAIMYGLVQPTTAVSQQARFSCPSGSCVYPKFTSLSVCSACADLTSSISITRVESRTRMNITLDRAANPPQIDREDIVRYSLPNGLHLDNSLEMVLRGTTNASRSLAFDNITTLIWSQSILRHPPSTNITTLPLTTGNPGVFAQECVLYYCVNTYTSTVADGILFKNITPSADHATRDPSSWALFSSFPDQPPPELPPARELDISYHPRFSSPSRTDLSFGGGYNISQAAINSISSFVQRTFATCTGLTVNCTTTLEPVADNWTPLNGFYMTVQSGPQHEPSAAQELWRAVKVDGLFQAVARSMSNALRAGGDADAAGATGEGNAVLGQVGVVMVLYRVDWRWLALHGLLGLGTFGAVAWVLARSRMDNVGVWGSSTLAVMAKGEDTNGLLRGADTIVEMEARARGTEVFLFGEQMMPRQRGEESDDEAWRMIR
ncbi:hypothetical protein QBC34DRAFT_60414 [Podospora aff. communis PSN243]|uniref:Uncharacterized protein n=1 Tax=Podospora aff. communis PSN243 TaxID=3040156 RepID=A0AAV9GU02_9PEZI|nr:hypothetical protein QBC34DRAFT_60414 [Podospora aff. communis PSN243]